MLIILFQLFKEILICDFVKILIFCHDSLFEINVDELVPVTAIALISLAQLPERSSIFFKITQHWNFIFMNILVENQLCVVNFSCQHKLIYSRIWGSSNSRSSFCYRLQLIQWDILVNFSVNDVLFQHFFAKLLLYPLFSVNFLNLIINIIKFFCINLRLNFFSGDF